jgi:hypothetical protein
LFFSNLRTDDHRLKQAQRNLSAAKGCTAKLGKSLQQSKTGVPQSMLLMFPLNSSCSDPFRLPAESDSSNVLVSPRSSISYRSAATFEQSYRRAAAASEQSYRSAAASAAASETRSYCTALAASDQS